MAAASGVGRVRRAWLLGAVGLSLSLLLVLALAVFIWPRTDPSAPPVDIGLLDDFLPGTVTHLMPRDSHGDPLVAFIPAVIEPGEHVVRLNVVRYEDGSLAVFSAVDPRSACTLPWRAEFAYDGRTGWFRDPCHGSTYDLQGRRVFGPSPRDMDRYRFSTGPDGRVVVDLSSLEVGATRVIYVEPGATPSPAATRTAAASGD